MFLQMAARSALAENKITGMCLVASFVFISAMAFSPPISGIHRSIKTIEGFKSKRSLITFSQRESSSTWYFVDNIALHKNNISWSSSYIKTHFFVILFIIYFFLYFLSAK